MICDLSLTRRHLDCYDGVQDKGVLIIGVRLPFFVLKVVRKMAECVEGVAAGQEKGGFYEELYKK